MAARMRRNGISTASNQKPSLVSQKTSRVTAGRTRSTNTTNALNVLKGRYFRKRRVNIRPIMMPRSMMLRPSRTQKTRVSSKTMEKFADSDFATSALVGDIPIVSRLITDTAASQP
jgi:hypothetical protein